MICHGTGYIPSPAKILNTPIVWSQWYVVSSQEKPWFLGGVTKKWPEDGMTRLYPYLASPSSVLSSVTGWPLQRDLKNRHTLWIRVFVDLIVSSWNLPFWCIISKIQKEMGMGQSPGTWWTPKIAGKWMFIPLKMVLIGIDPYPNTFIQESLPSCPASSTKHPKPCTVLEE